MQPQRSVATSPPVENTRQASAQGGPLQSATGNVLAPPVETSGQAVRGTSAPATGSTGDSGPTGTRGGISAQ
eukprot:12427886-Karenia_brevis.AAC.1